MWATWAWCLLALVTVNRSLTVTCQSHPQFPAAVTSVDKGEGDNESKNKTLYINHKTYRMSLSSNEPALLLKSNVLRRLRKTYTTKVSLEGTLGEFEVLVRHSK